MNGWAIAAIIFGLIALGSNETRPNPRDGLGTGVGVIVVASFLLLVIGGGVQ